RRRKRRRSRPAHGTCPYSPSRSGRRPYPPYDILRVFRNEYVIRHAKGTEISPKQVTLPPCCASNGTDIPRPASGSWFGGWMEETVRTEAPPRDFESLRALMVAMKDALPKRLAQVAA